MPRGHQRWLVTPGKNQKHCFAGAQDAVTGRITHRPCAGRSKREAQESAASALLEVVG